MSFKTFVSVSIFVLSVVLIPSSKALLCNLDGQGLGNVATLDDVEALAAIVVSGEDGICANGECNFDGQGGGSPNVGDVWKLLSITRGLSPGDSCSPNLTSIQITPASSVIFVGKTQQLTATCTYSNQISTNCTSQVTWQVGGPVSITSSGLVSSTQRGQSQINASLGSVNAVPASVEVLSVLDEANRAFENAKIVGEVSGIFKEILGIYGSSVTTASTTRNASVLPGTGQSRQVTINTTIPGGCAYAGSMTFQGTSIGNHSVTGNVTVSTPQGNNCLMESGTVNYSGTMDSSGGLTSPAISLSITFTAGGFVVSGEFKGAYTIATSKLVLDANGTFQVSLSGTPPGDESSFEGPFVISGGVGAYYAAGTGEALGNLTVQDGSTHTDSNGGAVTFKTPTVFQGNMTVSNLEQVIVYAGTANFLISAHGNVPALTGEITTNTDGTASGTLKLTSNGETVVTFTISGTTVTGTYPGGITVTETYNNGD